MRNAFRQSLALFLALSLAWPSGPAHADQRDQKALWTKILTSTVPLDAKEESFFSSSWRYEWIQTSFLQAFSTLPAGRSFDAIFNEIVRDFEETGANREEIQHFHANSYRLFRMIKTGQPKFANLAFEAWLDSIYALDFQKMSRLEFADHLVMMELIYTHAFLGAGPWSAAETDRVNQFFAGKREIGPKSWGVNFNAYLERNLDSAQDYGLNMAQGVRAGIVAVPLFFGTLIGSFNYVVEPATLLFYTDWVRFTVFMTTGLVSLGLSTATAFTAGRTFSRKWWSFAYQKFKRSSFLIESRKILKCESMLEGRK